MKKDRKVFNTLLVNDVFVFYLIKMIFCVTVFLECFTLFSLLVNIIVKYLDPSADDIGFFYVLIGKHQQQWLKTNKTYLIYFFYPCFFRKSIAICDIHKRIRFLHCADSKENR